MKLIKVIMRPEKTYKLKVLLVGMGYHGITNKTCSGFGDSKKVIKKVLRGKDYELKVESVQREELEFVVTDDKVAKVLETIREVAATDQGADGRIYISPLDDAIHIYSGNRHLGDACEVELKDEL
jgi:nitrogen regulatory protein PII